MTIQQLKGSMDIAEMRYNSHDSDDNKAVLDAARAAYEAAVEAVEPTEEEEGVAAGPVAPAGPVAKKLAPLPKDTAATQKKTEETPE